MDKQKACEAIHNLGGCDATDEWSKGYDAGIAAALEAIEALPAADVQPVKHGKWEICSDGYYPYCSVCKAEPESGKMTMFCPYCGARMDGGADNA